MTAHTSSPVTGHQGLTLPTSSMHHHQDRDGNGANTATSTAGDASQSRPSRPFRRWASSLRSSPYLHRGSSGNADESNGRSKNWWHIHLFRGMANDLRRRAPYYYSDWKDAWNYRVVPATIYMYFANILPALAFSFDMFSKTNMQYGVNEVLLASVLGAVVFAVLACQPLVIVGVTGPITVFNYTVYDIMKPTGVNYLAFMCWIGLWSLVLHWILAVTNSCNWLRYVTRFPCDIFGFYVAFIYLQKGIQVLEPLGEQEPFYLSIAIAVMFFGVAYVCDKIGHSTLFTHSVRVFLKDYGTPLTVIFFTGFVHIGRMRQVELEVLPTGIAFVPTITSRSWIVDFWNIPVGDVFLALPFAVLLTILFWFDHNVSSLIAQGTEFPLKKPAGFHWDLFLLGLTTGIAGILGLPFPNGLIPQAPFHTESLCVSEMVADEDEAGGQKGHYNLRPTHVVEQRASNLVQGLLTLVTMTGPLLIVLHLIPQAVLAGLFFVMGVQALEANGITAKILFLLRDASLTPAGHPLKRIPRRAALWSFVAVELVGFGATFAITQSVAAVGFPVFILALIPVRALLLPRWFTPLELALLDGPTASPFTMESVGGSYGGGGESDATGAVPQDDDAGSDAAAHASLRGGGGVLMSPTAGAVEGDRRRSGEDLAERGAAPPSASSAVHGQSRGEGGDGSIEMRRIGVNRRAQSTRVGSGEQ
ncbi:anion exchange protein 4 [Pyricularia oryzae 70-15]|uniref:Anion exchange protein 4 n=3 Tax=Pyricularia oryzae TaxID=318829 RepID=G4N0T8_PYRO7|nr:anion exchange protein 4 [Pyricularia oryzae 70-15]EHA51521.1 anion exchange protein 4 [Pyricularia oryzae 70-15]ELQ38153.1 anion exchange protein 4 [Pyricularia oryzae Y34]KAI7910582.1 anion exchange protein 4 [Pyricularia oryzae]KAI7923594.1 anion exchange protein 4 [Pyricularia oryzae]